MPRRIVAVAGLALVLCSSTQHATAQRAKPQNARALGKQLRKGSAAEQVQAAIDIGLLGARGAKAIPDLLWGIQTGNVELRKEAARSIGRIGKKAVPYLRKALGKRGNDSRIPALLAIPHLGDQAKSLQPLMRKLWRYEDAVLNEAVDDAFVGLGARALPDMIKALEQFGYETHACQVLARIGRPASPAIPALRKLLRSATAFNFAAADPLGAIRDPIAIPDLIESVHKATQPAWGRLDSLGAAAAMALGRFGPAAASAVPSLLELMELERQSGTDNMPERAITAIGDIGVRTPEVIERLRQRATTATPRIKKSALEAVELLEMAKTASIGSITRGINHQSVEIRLLAMQRAMERGPAAQGMVDWIAQRLTKEAETSVRLAAVAALVAIGSANDRVIDSLRGAAKSPDKQLAKAAKEALAHLGRLKKV